jgi:YD repeat-containing protein
MKVHYDKEVDVLRILLSERPIAESDEARPDVIMDYDAEGNVVGMEILNASRHAELPSTCEFAVAS